MRQFVRFATQQGSDVFISLYMCSFRHGISFEGPREVLLENSFAWLVPSTLILLTVNARKAPTFNLGFSRARFEKRGGERDQPSSTERGKREEIGSAGARERE